MKNKPDGSLLVIAHPMDSYHPDQGGGIRYLMNVLMEMKRLGWEPLVIGTQTADKVAENQEWRQIALVTEKPGKNVSETIPLWVKYLARLYLALPFTSIPKDAVILTHRIDCMLAFVIFKRSNPKVLVTAAPGYYLRGSHPQIYKLFGWLYHLAEGICIRGVDAIVPTDETTRSYYLRHYPNSRLAEENIPSSIDLGSFRPLLKELARKSLQWEMKDKVILFSGRLAAVKNIPLLLHAFEHVANQFPDTRLVLAGDGEEREHIKKLAEESSHRIEITGRIAPSEMCKYYAASDVLALCSTEEGSPTAVKEALACGTPVVSTDVGDVVKIIAGDPDLGSIVASNEMALAEAIIGYLNLPASASVQKKRSQAVRQYDTKCMGERFSIIINQAVHTKRCRGNQNGNR